MGKGASSRCVHFFLRASGSIPLAARDGAATWARMPRRRRTGAAEDGITTTRGRASGSFGRGCRPTRASSAVYSNHAVLCAFNPFVKPAVRCALLCCADNVPQDKTRHEDAQIMYIQYI